MALRFDSVGINSRILNGVLSYMDPLAESVDWSSPKMKSDVKKDAHELLCSLQRKHFETAKVNSSSVRALSVWTSTDRTAPYLLRKTFPSLSLTEGRRLKAKLRLGSHDLRCHVNNEGSVTKSELCQCCSLPQAVRETVYHSIGDCAAYDEARKECFSLLSLRFRVLLHYRVIRKLIFCYLMIIRFVWMPLFIVFLFTLLLQRAKLVEPTRPGKETLVS